LIGDCHIVRGSVFVIAGPAGVGKSRATLALALAGVTRGDWFGYSVKRPFKTYILQSENSELRIKTELQEINDKRLSGQLRITKPPPYGLCFQQRAFRDQLKAELERFEPDLVIIDPWNSVVHDDKSRDYLETYHLLRQVIPAGDCGPALGIVAHVRKPQVNSHAHGRALLYELAGSHVLGTIARSVWVMEHASDDVAEDRM
jgi:hypothetical protein